MSSHPPILCRFSQLTVSRGADPLFVQDRLQYLDSIAEYIGAKPNLWDFRRERLALLPTLLFGPAGMRCCCVVVIMVTRARTHATISVQVKSSRVILPSECKQLTKISHS